MDERFVLVIEDDPAIRDLMVDLLAEAGYSAEGVMLASQAGEHLRDPRCSLIVTDLNAPFYTAENRDEVWQEALGLLQTDRAVPIIVVTAHSAAAQEVASERGVQAIVAKPFQVDDFLATVAKVFPPNGG